MTLFQTAYISLALAAGRLQNLEAAGALGSLLRFTDSLVDERGLAVPSSRTSNRFQSLVSIFGPSVLERGLRG